MSIEDMDVDTSTPKKHKHSKDHSEKSSSKKRRREEQLQDEAQDPAIEAQTSSPKPSKKRRKSEKSEPAGHNDQSHPDIKSEEFADRQAAPGKSKEKRSGERGQSVPETESHDADAIATSSKKERRDKKEKKRKSQPDDQSTITNNRSSSPAILPTTEPALKTASAGGNALNRGMVEQNTPFVLETASLLLPLAPAAFDFPLQGLCAEHLSPLLLTYHPPLHGIVLSYSRPRLSDDPASEPTYTRRPAHAYRPTTAATAGEDRARSPSASSVLSQPASETASERSLDLATDGTTHHDPSTGSALTRRQKRKTYAGPLALAATADEYATPFAWLTADFVLLRPDRGVCLQGEVQVQNPSWLGLVCWNFFNAGIPRRRLPKGWKWVEATAPASSERTQAVDGDEAGGEGDQDGAVADASEGYWADEDGSKVQGTIEFRLVDFESSPSTDRERGFVSITGTLLGEEEDQEVDREERESEKGGSSRKGRRLGRDGEE